MANACSAGFAFSLGLIACLAVFVLADGFASAEASHERISSRVQPSNKLFGHDCSYHCPEGTEKVDNPDYEQSSNGCGSYGIHFEPKMFPNITSCCDVHDYCYGTCGTVKRECDLNLKECLANACGPRGLYHEVCKLVIANLFRDATAIFGCHAFHSAQEEACRCKPLDVAQTE